VLRYMGHNLGDNRHGLIASAVVTIADGHTEREAAKAMINDAVQANNDPEVGQDHWQHAPGDGTGTTKSRSDVRAHDGSLQPHPHATLRTSPPSSCAIRQKR
jgi:hypothetical protein